MPGRFSFPLAYTAFGLLLSLMTYGPFSSGPSCSHLSAAVVFQTELQEQAGDEQPGDDSPSAQSPDALFYGGSYEEASAAALELDKIEEGYNADEAWSLLAIEAEMEMGHYKRALEIVTAALEKYPNSVRHRWLAADVYRFNDDPAAVQKMLEEIEDKVRRTPWRYRDVENQLALVEFLLQQKVDAKEVLSKILQPIKKEFPRMAEVYQSIGKLALQKSDYALAAENFEQACKWNADDPENFLGLAKAFRPSDWQKASEALQTALSINPRHIDSLLMLIDQQISGENYEAAEELLERVTDINPHEPSAWSYRAVLAHLRAEFKQEGEAREKALAHWSGNPAVDYMIGRELSEKYRFQEGAEYQRRALAYDRQYLPAKMQLAHDLLRLGQELEGWKLAEEVFDADQYSVVAHNLLTLRDNLTDFVTLERNGFVVRMDRKETGLYGEEVLDLLQEAEQVLVEKYQAELQKPIFIEVFPRQQDFAIRTFGLPGGDGYLGVCFGRVITMNSPAAQGSSLTSWRSVLWHEFCHVVTLQKTRNKMPRWLSEGISVYEEGLRDPAWGQNINPTFQQYLLGEELTPVSQLSAAFLSPKSAMHVQFAYYESSLVVRYLIEKFGKEALIKVLDELADGMNINDALSRHAAPIDFIDRDFSSYARELAVGFAPEASFKLPESSLPETDEDWKRFLEDHGTNVPVLMLRGQKLLEAGQPTEALPLFQRVIELAPDVANDARRGAARCHQELDDETAELIALEDLSRRDSDSVEVLTRILELVSAAEDWEKTGFYADRLVALNPLTPTVHQYRARAAAKLDQPLGEARSLRALTELEPVDPADVHYRLAVAYHKLGKRDLARRHVLFALEQAPRYREAHRLLLSLVPPLVPGTDAPPRPTEKPIPLDAATTEIPPTVSPSGGVVQ